MSKKKHNHKNCAIPTCERDAGVGDLCTTCYHGLYYWKNKTPSQIMKRQKQLGILRGRMDILQPRPVVLK